MKKTNVIKTVIAAVVMTASLGVLTGCSIERNVSKTETHTVTDADGNTTTTVKTNNNGVVTTQTYTTSADDVKTPVDVEEIDTDAPQVFSQVPLAIANDMGCDIASLNLKLSTDEEWSDDFLGDDVVIEDGVVARGLWVTYDEENRFLDIHMADADGETIDFNGLELPTEVDEEEGITLSFEYNEEDDTYTVYAIN